MQTGVERLIADSCGLAGSPWQEILASMFDNAPINPLRIAILNSEAQCR
jgi:hypothetical protein